MHVDMERSLAAAQQLDEFWVSYERQLEKDVYLEAMLGLAKLDNAGYDSNRDDTSCLASVVLRWRM